MAARDNSYNLRTFRDVVKRIGRNQYFEVQIPSVGDAHVVTAMARSTTMPPRTQETIDVYYRGMPMKIDSRATFDTWTVNFMCDEGSTLRNVFLDWMNSAYSVSDLENYSHGVYKRDDVSFFQLAADKAPMARVDFVGLFPTTVGQLDFTQDGGDYLKFDVTFSYDFWTMKDVTKTDANSKDLSSSLGNGVDIAVGPKGNQSGTSNLVNVPSVNNGSPSIGAAQNVTEPN